MNPSEYLYVANSPIHGKGVFAKFTIEKNTGLFLVADLNRYKKRKGWITKLGKLVNHQLDGNCFLRKVGSLYILFSNRTINPNEELTSNYTVLPKPFKNTVNGYK